MRSSRPLTRVTLILVCDCFSNLFFHFWFFSLRSNLSFPLLPPDAAVSKTVYHVLLRIQKKATLGEFFRLINDKPIACSLFEVYCRQQVRTEGLKTLRDYYLLDDRHCDLADVVVVEAYNTTTLADKIKGLRNAQNTFADAKDGSFAARATEEQIKLLQEQEQLEGETNDTFVGLSLAQTVHKCIIKGQSLRAEKIRNNFKMNEKQCALRSARKRKTHLLVCQDIIGSRSRPRAKCSIGPSWIASPRSRSRPSATRFFFALFLLRASRSRPLFRRRLWMRA